VRAVLKKLFRRPDDDDERGAAFVLTAISMVLLLWAGATGVDVGFTVYGSRQAQAMADTAALDLARYISYADTLTSISAVQTYLDGKLATVLADNGSNANLSVVPGYFNTSTKAFTADGFTGNSCQPVIAPPINRPGCNAVEVTAHQSVPQVFFGGFNSLSGHGGNNVSGSVSGTSIATQNPVAGFSIGTYLANLNSTQSPVLNALLSPLGSSVNLTAVGYQGLVTANVTLKDLINASGGLLSATNIMTAQLTAGQWLSIYETAVGSDYGTGSTQYTSLQALGTFSMAQSTDVKLCQLVNINVASTQYGTNCSPSNSSISQQGLDASVNVLQMLTTEAELANGTNGINVTSALNLTVPVLGLSVGNVMLSTQVISPAQVAYGPVGTTASDAQVQATLSMNLTLLGVSLGNLSIPLSAATGTATLNTMTCNDDSLYSMALTVNTNTVSTGSSGTGITLTLLGVSTTQGSISISGLSNKGVTFTGPANPIGSNIPPTPATAASTTNPNPESVGSTSPSVTFTAAVGANSSVTATMAVLDGVLGMDLQALGLTVGGATVAGLAADCGTVSLAQ
jgi:uncharacterized membrane protein